MKVQLHQTNETLKSLGDEHDQLEEEYEQQSTVHAEFVKELTEKETGWKTRLASELIFSTIGNTDSAEEIATRNIFQLQL